MLCVQLCIKYAIVSQSVDGRLQVSAANNARCTIACLA